MPSPGAGILAVMLPQSEGGPEELDLCDMDTFSPGTRLQPSSLFTITAQKGPGLGSEGVVGCHRVTAAVKGRLMNSRHLGFPQHSVAPDS